VFLVPAACTAHFLNHTYPSNLFVTSMNHTYK